jgi:primosomal protein N''
MKSQLDKTVVPITQTVPRLEDILLALISQDPRLSISILFEENYDIPHIKAILKKNTPFIQVLPQVLMRQINSFLAPQAWASLFNVNKAWRTAVTTSVIRYFDTSPDISNLKQIQTYDFDALMKNLLEEVEHYSQTTHRRPEQAKALTQLGKEVPLLSNPIAKLLHCQKKINQVQRGIQNEYSRSISFFGKNNSQLYQILNSVSPDLQKLTQTLGFKKMILCAHLAPEHPVSKLFLNALLEIKSLKDIAHVPRLQAETSVSPGYFL